MRRFLVGVVVAAALAAATPVGAATINIGIVRSGFVPSIVTINPDDTVVWTNRDSINHQVVADSGSFVSPILRPVRSYSFTFVDAGTYRYRDALNPSRRATIRVRQRPTSVTLAANVPVVVYGSETRLQGVVSSKRAGETVTLYANPFGQSSYSQLVQVVTGPGGAFDFPTTPTVLTSFVAQFRGISSREVTVEVRPKLTFTPGARGFFLVRVTGAHSFAGRAVYVQRKTQFGQWLSIRKLVLGRYSGKLFRLARRKGTTRYRIFMTVNQAGAGYLSSWSGTQTIRRR
jgi:plastocyanin